MDLAKEAETIEKYIISNRRYFHEHPELSFEEEETTKYIVSQIIAEGLEPHTYPDYKGVWVDINGKAGNSKKTVLLRADIDALPVTEETGLEYSSKNKGLMHACGHDNHAAMLLGAMKLLNNHVNEIDGRVRLLFQAAEESCHGAEYYVRAGLLDDVSAAFGLHVWGDLESSFINLEEGARMSSCDNFTIEVKGLSAHGSAPNFGIDAITTASAIILQLQTLVSRRNDPRDPLAITVGEINGGQRFNIIPDKVVMKGTVRSHSNKVRERIESLMRDVIEGVAKANGAQATLQYDYYPGVLINDGELTKIARKSAAKLYGQEVLKSIPPAMGSEDFSYFLEKIPGVYALLGSRDESKGYIYQNHNSRYDVDEGILKRGTALYAQFAVDYLADK